MDLNTTNRYIVITVIEAESDEYGLILNKMDERIDKVGIHLHYTFLVYAKEIILISFIPVREGKI